ncbi:MAG: hypothetical protein ACOYBY_16350, partial [Dermatophilaceae bacterium]
SPPTPTTPPPTPTITQTVGPLPTASAPGADAESAARQELVNERASTLPGLTLDGRWVLQLSSKRDGMVDPLQTAANGTHTFHYADITTQFDQLSDLARRSGMTPLVLTAGDFGSKHTQDGDNLWVLLADPGGVSSKATAQMGCARLFPQVSAAELTNWCLPRTLVALPG